MQQAGRVARRGLSRRHKSRQGGAARYTHTTASPHTEQAMGAQRQQQGGAPLLAAPGVAGEAWSAIRAVQWQQLAISAREPLELQHGRDFLPTLTIAEPPCVISGYLHCFRRSHQPRRALQTGRPKQNARPPAPSCPDSALKCPALHSVIPEQPRAASHGLRPQQGRRSQPWGRGARPR